MRTEFALMIYCSILFAAWTITGDHMANAQIISLTSISIMPGHSLEKIFRAEKSSNPLSLAVHTDSDSTQLGILLTQFGNGTAYKSEPVVNTSFMNEFAFNFTPKADSLYKLKITNYGVQLLNADIKILYLVALGDKVEDTEVNTRIIRFLVVMIFPIILTATIMKYGIWTASTRLKLRRQHS